MGHALEIVGAVDAAREIAAVVAADHEHLGRDALHAIDEAVGPAPQPGRIIHRHQDEAVAAGGRHVAGPADGEIAQQAWLERRARHRRDRGQLAAHHGDRRVAAVDHEACLALGGKLPQPLRQLRAFVGIVALDVDEEAPLGKRVEHLVERRHHADAAAAERIGLAAVGGVAVADVERLQLRQRVLAGDAAAVGAAVHGPVVEHGEMAVGGRVDVELDDVGAGLERRPHRRQRVLQERVLRRMDARRRAGVVLEALEVVGLRQAAVGEQRRPGRPVEHQPRRVVEIDEGREQTDARGRVAQRLFHASPRCRNVESQSGNNAATRGGKRDAGRALRYFRKKT